MPPPRLARWGAQLDVRQIRQTGPGELSAEAVAGYIAKYATAMIRLVVASTTSTSWTTCGCQPTSPGWPELAGRSAANPP
jgi:hypothetical protein